MGLPRNKSSLHYDRCLSQATTRTRSHDITSLSQPVPSTSTNNAMSHNSQRLQGSSNNRMIADEESQLVNSVIRYLFVLDKKKKIMNKQRIIKDVFGDQRKHFHRVMIKAKDVLFKVFGYRLVELPGTKYMLTNAIENASVQIPLSESGSRQQVLLFLVLTHIFMHDGSTNEALLLEFLTNLGVTCLDNDHHYYFGNVMHSINEVFVAQQYLEKIVDYKDDDSSKVEYKWGPRAEYEFTRRAALKFVSEVYNSWPMEDWRLQYKTMIACEQANDQH